MFIYQVHVKWRVDLAQKLGRMISEYSLVLAWGQFGLIEVGLFLAPIFEG